MSTEQGARDGLSPDAATLRAHLRWRCVDEAEWYRIIHTAASKAQARFVAHEHQVSALFPRPLRYTDAQLHELVLSEVAVALGATHDSIGKLVNDARTLVTVMPDVLAALDAGLLDQARVRYLLDQTRTLDPAVSAKVATAVLAADHARLAKEGIPVEEAGVWDLDTPQTWRTRVRRTIAREVAALDDAQPLVVVPQVHVEIEDAHHGQLVFTGTAEDVTRLHQRIQDAADQLPPDLRGPDGDLLSAAEREGVALLSLCGNDTHTTGPSSRRRELGIVLHIDTLLDDGPSAGDPGELRNLTGNGQPIPVPAQDARHLATTALAKGTTTCLLLADDDGMLVRMLRLGPAPETGWTRAALLAAGRAALATAKPLTTADHDPTVTIDEHVRAAHPVSVAPGRGAATSSGSRRVDLDHRIPHPRGPTSADNLQPLTRAPHRHKTRDLWHCRTPEHDTHAVRWTTRLGVTWTYRPAPLPGHAHGEGHAPR